MKALTWLRRLLLLGIWLGSADVLTAAPEPQTIVFFAESRPVLIRLHVRVDGEPLAKVHHDAWTAYVTRLFHHLDRDGDGFLSEAEASRLPAARQVFPATGGSKMQVNVAFNFRVLDANNDGKLSLEEVLDYYRQYSGPALQTRYTQPLIDIRPQLGDALFTLLDTNKDGKLSRAELAAALDLLKLDANEDELLTPPELAPQLYPNVNADFVGILPPARRAGAPETSPFLILAPGESPAILVRRLLERYGRAGSLRDKTLSREEIGLDAAAFARLDVNSDGKLDAQELEKFADGPADLELVYHGGKLAEGEKSLEILRPAGKETTPAVTIRETPEGVILTLGKTQIEFRGNEGRPAIPSQVRQGLLERFRSADTAGKGYLTLRDAEVRGFFPAQFGLLDRDGDGKLTEKELLAYLDEVQERQALASTAMLLISSEGRSLFDLLDRNRDGRLSARELRQAPELLTRLGRKPDDTLTAANLPRSYVVAVGLGGASFDRFGGRGSFTPSGMPLLLLDWTPPGLAWFDKMDRNHDGEVSWREFLGSREAFRRLDTNGDGVISLEEALRASK